jgi:hypothetical protein
MLEQLLEYHCASKRSCMTLYSACKHTINLWEIHCETALQKLRCKKQMRLTWSPQLNPKPHPLRELRLPDESHDSEIGSGDEDTHPGLQSDVGEGREGELGGG